MKSSLLPESGILQTFRRFIVVRLSLVLFILVIYVLTVSESMLEYWRFLGLILVDSILLLLYLSMPQLERALKTMYLPLGIFWASVGPLVQVHVIFFYFPSDIPVRAALLMVLQPILVLLIPLIMIAWRYSFRIVLLFCGLTFLFDMLLVVIVYSNSGSATASPIPGMTFLRTVLFLVVGYLIANLMKVQREQQRRLLETNRRLEEANDRMAQYAATLEQLTISRERNRMARELHDVLAHTMSGVAVELEGVRALLRVDPDQAEKLLGQSLSAVRDGLSETRRALKSLRAAPIEDLGLGLAVRSLTESVAGRAGLQTELQIDGEMREYPVEVQQCFYRVVQEALTNVVAHSQASRVQVALVRDGNVLRLTVQDDGVGFDEQTIDLEQRYGLLGIRERAEMIHGEVAISSQPGRGTRIVLAYEAAAGTTDSPAGESAQPLQVEAAHG